MDKGKLLVVLVAAIAGVFVLLSLLCIGLYGGAMNLSYGSCKMPCSNRTGGMGVTAGVLGMLLGSIILIAFLVPLFVDIEQPMLLTILRLLLLVCVFVEIIFYLTAWALMATDINDFNSKYGDFCNGHAPDVWNAALVFGLFTFLDAIALFVSIAVSLVVERMSAGGSLSPYQSYSDTAA